MNQNQLYQTWSPVGGKPLKDIYNVEEFKLFCQCLPNKTYQFKSEKCSGGKLSKIRINGLAAQLMKLEKSSLLERPEIHGTSRTSSFYHAATEINAKAGWNAICLKSGSERGQEILCGKEYELH